MNERRQPATSCDGPTDAETILDARIQEPITEFRDEPPIPEGGFVVGLVDDE